MSGLPSVGPGQLCISKSQGFAVLGMFFDVGLDAGELTTEDLCFAQALLTHAIDLSFKMGFVEGLVSGMAKVPSGPQAAIKAILVGAGKNLLKFKDKNNIQKMIANPVLYQTVVNQITRNFKTVWAARVNTGSLDL